MNTIERAIEKKNLEAMTDIILSKKERQKVVFDDKTGRFMLHGDVRLDNKGGFRQD